ncbi:RNA 2',3'-cyclic phosphodiesterase [Pollutimonas bauzanensis]|uniref:RNA 2',3'-cyclic phosphodiesterase n=1 Tax=Pollutimonas bauzanensis TaxID=658167 RepID=A0A1M5V501_9BURK|nr:RNA 2',3'-cyclic phosphodiesterase [Pollutimonas bauzanensis]SHH70337.1 2'-5' RNA ligase [Pollutimonas bauzanensis]
MNGLDTRNSALEDPAAIEGPQRLFFALWPSAETAAEISAWAHAAHALCGGRVLRPETLHMTLAFLGNTPAARARELIHAAPAWTLPTGRLELRHFGRFAGPRIVWAGPSAHDGDRIPWLDEAYGRLWSYLSALGWQRPPSVFRPHVSLLRKAGDADLGALRPPPIAWTPARCVLAASRPSEEGSYYQVLAAVSLENSSLRP